mgnify:CR=1 FL=1
MLNVEQNTQHQHQHSYGQTDCNTTSSEIMISLQLTVAVAASDPGLPSLPVGNTDTVASVVPAADAPPSTALMPSPSASSPAAPELPPPVMRLRSRRALRSRMPALDPLPAGLLLLVGEGGAEPVPDRPALRYADRVDSRCNEADMAGLTGTNAAAAAVGDMLLAVPAEPAAVGEGVGDHFVLAFSWMVNAPEARAGDELSLGRDVMGGPSGTAGTADADDADADAAAGDEGVVHVIALRSDGESLLAVGAADTDGIGVVAAAADGDGEGEAVTVMRSSGSVICSVSLRSRTDVDDFPLPLIGDGRDLPAVPDAIANDAAAASVVETAVDGELSEGSTR